MVEVVRDSEREDQVSLVRALPMASVRAERVVRQERSAGAAAEAPVEAPGGGVCLRSGLWTAR